jgi:hypothetical protein
MKKVLCSIVPLHLNLIYHDVVMKVPFHARKLFNYSAGMVYDAAQKASLKRE